MVSELKKDFKPILEKLSKFFLFATQDRVSSPEQVMAIRKKIEFAKVNLCAVLGKTEILVRELLDLSPGDVIPLNRLVTDPIPIYVGEFMKFRSIPGLNGEHLAVQILETVKEGGEVDG